MTNFQKAQGIASRLRSKGYSITARSYLSHAIFEENGKFIFATDFELLSEKDCEGILLEILKEKNNVSIPTKN